MKTNLKFKKITSLLLTFLMILSMGTFSAFAEDATPYTKTYTAKALQETATEIKQENFGDSVKPWTTGASAFWTSKGHGITFDFDGESGVYNASIVVKVSDDTCDFAVVNNNTLNQTTITTTKTTNDDSYKTDSFTSDNTLEIFNGDSLTVKPTTTTANAVYFVSVTFTKVGEAVEKNFIVVNAQDYMTENGEGIDYSALPTLDTAQLEYNGIKIDTNGWVNYEVVAEEAGFYDVSLTYRGNSYDAGRWVYLTSNPVAHTNSGILTTQGGKYGVTSTWNGSNGTPAIQLYLSKGTNIVTFKVAVTTYISKMVFTKEKIEEPEDPTKVKITINGQDYMTENGEGIDYSALPTLDTAHLEYNGITIAKDGWVNYEVVAEEAGLYDVSLTYRGNSYDAGRWVYLTSNPVAHTNSGILTTQGGKYGETSTWNGSNGTPAIQIYLNKGTNIVTFKVAVTTYISKMVFTKEKTGDTTTIYQFALGYDDGGVYNTTDSTEIKTDEAKALLENGSNIQIGKKTLNDTIYGSFVKYNINASENGIYKITMNMGNYSNEWINALKNETLGISEKGIVPKSTTLAPVSTWTLTDGGEYVDITIPMVEGENVISFKKAESDIWFNKLTFTKVDEYTPEEPEEPTPEIPENPGAYTIEVNAKDFIPGGKDVGHSEDTVTLDGNNGVKIAGGNWLRYAVYAEEAGLYNVTLNYKTEAGEWFNLINETLPVERVRRGIVPNSNKAYVDTTTWTEQNSTVATPITIHLNKGTNFIKVGKENNSAYLSKITFTKNAEGVTVYKNALDILDGGRIARDDNGSLTVNGDMTSDTAIIKDGSDIKIGGKNDATYGSYVQYKVNAPETGYYKVTFNLGAYGGEHINALTNESLGVTKSGIVTATQTKSLVDKWKLQNATEESYITIPMIKGENIITIKKLTSDIWFNDITFSKVAEYPYEYDTQYLYANATSQAHDEQRGEKELPWGYGSYYVTLRNADDHVEFEFKGETAKYLPTVDITNPYEQATGIEIINKNTGKSVTISAESLQAIATHQELSPEIGLDINKGDLVRIKRTSGVMLLFGISFDDIGDIDPEEAPYYTASQAEHTNVQLSEDETLSMTKGAFAEFNIKSDDCLYYVEITASVLEDTLLKLTVGKEEVYYFAKAGADIATLMNLPANGSKIKVFVEEGNIELEDIYLEKDTDTEAYSQVLSGLAAAEDFDDAVTALTKLYYVDVKGDLGEIFYPESVINTLKENVYSDITALLSDYSEIIYNERTNPSIVLKNSEDTAVTELENGDMTLEVSGAWIKKGTSVFFVTYNAQGSISAVDTKEYDGKKITLSVNVKDSANETFKILFWDDMVPYTLKDSTSEVNRIYVSQANGSDTTGDGSFSAPVKTLAKAKEIVKDMKQSLDTDIYVVIEGDYFITEPLTFTADDSGLGENKIIYQGNGNTVINGGVEVTDFVTRTNLVTAEVEATDVRQLYVNGEPATMSKGGLIAGEKSLYSEGGKTGIIVDTASLPQGFENETSAEVVYVWEWIKSRFTVEEVKALEDGKTALILGEAFSYITDDTKNRITNGTADIYLENCVCLTDEAGEFTFDREAKTITYYKNSGTSISSMFIPVSEGLINICGNESEKVKNIAFENIVFENGAWNYPSEAGLFTGQADTYFTAAGQESYLGQGDLIAGQISLNNCENIEFNNNTIKNIGSVAFTLNEGVENCKISGNTIKNTAAGAVRVGNTKHYTDAYYDKLCAGNIVSNNEITDISLQYSNSPAVTVFYAKDTQVTHNTIKNTPYSGISLGWGWGTWNAKYCANNEISYNRIENVMIENGISTLRDGAHIYTNGKQTNTQIHDNYMIKSSDATSNKIGNYGGIYFDNGSSNITAFNNVIEKCYNWMNAPHGHIIDEKTGEERDSYSNIILYDNYSDTPNYSVNSQSTDVVTVEKADSNDSEEATAIKEAAGVQ